MTNSPLLRIKNLVLHFKTAKGSVRAVDGIDFELDFNEAVVIVGESGCGKSSLAKAILRLLPRNVQSYSGQIYLNDVDIMRLPEEEFRKKVRWVSMSMVPQAAMNSLNPVLKVGEQVAEPIILHGNVKKDYAMLQAKKMFQNVGVPNEFLQRYAFELSGGMRQRVAIAMALVTVPNLIILDEPTSALDVLTQANIFNVLKRIKSEMDISYILITHDIATSSELADKVAVMYAGQIVEVGSAGTFFKKPLHPYSEKLMNSVPRLHGTREPEFIVGQPPSLLDLPSGCRFKDRCSERFGLCENEPPMFGKDGHIIKCWLYSSDQEMLNE
jgi:oligopeptide/dipeptide ABC transporter ATP-binding protein